MSGRAIGTIAGAAIGFALPAVGVALGATIGGIVGGLIDPETMQGAQFSGRSIAGSESGLARAIIYGTTVVEGRLMDGESTPRKGTRTESAGKGGPEIEHDTALLSYAIEICESSELRDTLIAGILAVWEDEKLVYDVREDSLVSAADNAKWLENKTFYFGDETQTPSALLESIHGAGNVPAYRGTARMDVEDEDMVLHGERLPRYRFLPSRCAVEPPNDLLVTGSPIVPGGPMWAAAQLTQEFAFTGLTQASGADMERATPAYRNGIWAAAGVNDARISIDKRLTWQELPNDHAGNGEIAAGPVGWVLAIPSGPDGPFDKTARANPIQEGFSSFAFETDLRAHGEESSFCRYVGGYYWIDTGAQGELVKSDDLIGVLPVVYNRGGETDAFAAFWDIEVSPVDPSIVYATGAWGVFSSRAQMRKSTDGGATFPDLLIDTAIGDVDAPLQMQFGGNTLLVHCRGDSHVWTSVDGFAESHVTGVAGDRTSNPPKYAHQGIGRHIAYARDGYFYCISTSSSATPALGDKCVRTEDGITFSEPVPLQIQDAYGIAASTAFEATGGGIIIPDAPGYEIDPITGEIVGPESDVGNACGMYLDEVVRSLYRLGSQQLTDDMLDLSALAPYYVRGYSVADVGATSADAIEPLRRTYFFDLPEYDGNIRARLRGGDTDWVIDPDDVIPGEESTLEGKRGQETSYPKKLQLTYVALSTDYKPTTQIAEDINPDTFTNTEESYQTNLVLEDDESAKVADVMLKVMRTEREDEQKFSLPIQYVGIIPSDILSLEGRRYRVDQMRVERNRVVIERAVYDRASAYYSEAVGVAGIQRPPPVSTVRGPVVSAVMNAPVLRDEDDRGGVYWAAAGYLPGYLGAILQLSRDGGLTYEDGPQITTVSTMGLLTADLPSASAFAQDNTNTLRVKLNPGARDLDSTTYEGLIAEENVAAIMYADGTVEIIQFQTAVETADREYDLTGLMRGRQDTVTGEHLTGARFVLLDENVRFVAIRPDDLGKTLTFRAVSIGTVADDNVTQTITMTTIESLREWQPYNVVVTADGLGGYCVEWIGRARLGSSAIPVHSQWFEGYRVTFTFDSEAYVVDTTNQSTCVSAATMLEEFGIGYGAPVVTVRARSRVATNDDDFDSPPAGPGNPLDGSELFVASGTWPGGYVGVPYVLRNGDAGIVTTGGYWDATAYGEISPGVGVLGGAPLSSTFSAIGIPNAAGTYAADVELTASSPIAGHSGTAVVTNSVTIAAKPSFSTIDLRLRENSRDILVATTPPWTTFELPSGSLYCYGFDTGQCRGEFTITGSTGPLVVGINAAGGELTPVSSRPGIALSFPNHAAVETTGDGTYAIEYDCATGDWEVFKAGTGSIGSGNMPLPSGNLVRIVCGTNRVSPVQVKGNFGNEAWVVTPTGGYAGVPMPTLNVPAAWDDRSTPYHIMRGGNSFTGANFAMRLRGPGHTLASPGRSSGKWRFGIFANGRKGLAVSTYDSTDGGLGGPGTANSVGYDGTTLRWCFGGVASSAPVTVPVASYPYVVYALDMDNSEVTLCYEDFDGNVFPLYTIPSVPAGTWFPAESNSTNNPTLTYNPAGPLGFDDWKTTA